MKKEDLEKVIITSLALIKRGNIAGAEQLLQITHGQIEASKKEN